MKMRKNTRTGSSSKHVPIKEAFKPVFEYFLFCFEKTILKKFWSTFLQPLKREIFEFSLFADSFSGDLRINDAATKLSGAEQGVYLFL